MNNRLRDADEVHGHLRRICFKTGPPQRVGAELEWLVSPRDEPRTTVPLELVTGLLAAAAPFPGGSRVTIEPGGQVELSSRPAADVGDCHAVLAQDMRHLRSTLDAAGLDLVPFAIDPERRPLRQLHEPRYDAMAAYFDTLTAGLGSVMMASTAAIQVNLDAGVDAPDQVRRWELLHAVGPALSAAFANSPRHNGRWTGWKSTRQAVWLRLDPRRTHAPRRTDDPMRAWTDYVLAAPVMMLRTSKGPWRAAPGFTFGDWLDGRVAGVAPPTEDDLAYHLTTLFPPVRPRGWFEVRYLDAQSPEWWPVPVVLLATLLEHPGVASVAAEACEPVAGAWERAARDGVAEKAMARSALAVFEATVDAVEDTDLRALVAGFMDRYVGRGLCPADDPARPPVAGDDGPPVLATIGREALAEQPR